MRNLKRALSLALASIMVIGMMVTGAGAAFSDQESIKNTEAVEVVNVLGIIVGKPGGSFAPGELVDRASMAKMITLALNGGIEPVLGTKVKPTYSDIKGTWAESYIEYCTTGGVIAGDGTGKFNPTGSVTGSQAAKMLLVALGYESAAFMYTGADWEMNVNSDANKAGIYAGLTGLQASAPLSRDNAAQMIYNALNSKVMEKSRGIEAATGKVTYSYALGNKTLLETKFNVIRVTGVVIGNEFANLNGSKATDKNKTNIEITDNGGQAGFNLNTKYLFNTTTGMNEIGKTVSMYVKTDVSDLNKAANASKCTVVGAPILATENKMVTVTTGEANADLKKILDDNNFDIVVGTKFSSNYDQATNVAFTANAAGQELTYIDNNNDGNVDYAIQLTRSFGEVTFHSTANKGSISVTSENPALGQPPVNSTDAKAKVVGFDDVAKGDMVMVYTVQGIIHLEKVTAINVTVSSIRGAKVVADGTTYIQSGLVANVDGSNNLQTAVKDSLGKSVKFFLDTYNNVLKVSNADTTSNYLFVEKVGSGDGISDETRTQMVLSDGTSVVANAYWDDAGTKKAPVANTVYTYSVDKNGVYTLNAVAPANVNNIAAGGTITKGNATVGTGLANSASIFVVKPTSSTSYTMYTGINSVPSMTGVTAYGVMDKNGVQIVTFVTTSSLTGAPKSIYAITGEANITSDDNGKLVYSYDVVYEGAHKTMTGAANLFGGVSGLYVGAVVNGDEISSKGALNSTYNHGLAARASNGLVQVVGGTTYTYDAKTVFVIVDKDGETAETMVEIGSNSSIMINPVVGSDNTSTIIIVYGTSDRADVANYVYILK